MGIRPSSHRLPPSDKTGLSRRDRRWLLPALLLASLLLLLLPSIIKGECTMVKVCWDEYDPGAGTMVRKCDYEEHCPPDGGDDSGGGGETPQPPGPTPPGGGGTPVPTSPLPTPTDVAPGDRMRTQECLWDCPSEYEGELWEGWWVEMMGSWCLIGGRRLTECGEPPCLLATPEPGGDWDNPCKDVDWFGDGVQCDGDWTARVSASIPCCRVQRVPYPRGLVTEPNFFTINCSVEEAWSDTMRPNPPRDWCDGNEDIGTIASYKIGLRWERIPGFLAEWDFDDGESAMGEAPYHIYSSSSYGRPQNGVGRSGEPLPAYQVRASTLWQVFSRDIYDRCECVHTSTLHTCGHDSDCDRKGCSYGEEWQQGNPCYYNKSETYCDEWDWVTYDSGWQRIDLSPYIGTWYAESFKTGPEVTGLEPNPPCGVVPVPIIEVQGVIENP